MESGERGAEGITRAQVNCPVSSLYLGTDIQTKIKRQLLYLNERGLLLSRVETSYVSQVAKKKKKAAAAEKDILHFPSLSVLQGCGEAPTLQRLQQGKTAALCQRL